MGVTDALNAPRELLLPMSLSARRLYRGRIPRNVDPIRCFFHSLQSISLHVPRNNEEVLHGEVHAYI